MYRLSYDDLTLYDPRDEDNAIRDTELHLGVNEAGSFRFTIESGHPYAAKLQKIAGTLELQSDDKPIYRGRIIRCSSDWNNSITVESEGVLACLNDSVIPPFSFPSDAESDPDYEEALLHGNVVAYFFRRLLEQHNGQVTQAQRLMPGNVTVRDSNNYIFRACETYTSTWSILKSKLFDSALGGYLLVRYEEDGTYLDYYAELPDSNAQTIEFGENLLDLSSDEDASGIFSAIFPLGSDNLTIESEVDRKLSDDLVKSGPIIYSISARQKFGNVTSIQTWEDITQTGNLLAKAADAMLHGASAIARTITVSACDLHLTDQEISQFVVGRKTTIHSGPHNLTAVYPLTTLDVDIQNPGSATIRLSMDTGKESLTQSIGSVEANQMNQSDQLYTELEKYYTKAQTQALLVDKVGKDDLGSMVADTLAKSSVTIGGTLTVGGIPMDGYARFS